MLAGSSFKKTVRYGSLTVIDVEGKSHIFSGQNGPAVTIRLTDPRLQFRSFFQRAASTWRSLFRRITYP